jgi:hypothetical protein
MRKGWLIWKAVALTVMMGLVFGGASVWAAQNVLTGKTWVQMTHEQKVAYIWGAGDVVDVEQELMNIYPELRVENLSFKAVEAAQVAKAEGEYTVNDIVAGVDEWYRSNPDKRDTAVLRVIWDLMIKPKLTTGIAGRPLK